MYSLLDWSCITGGRHRPTELCTNELLSPPYCWIRGPSYKEPVRIKPAGILLAWVSVSVSLSHYGLYAALEAFPSWLDTVLRELLDINTCPGFYSPGKLQYFTTLNRTQQEQSFECVSSICCLESFGSTGVYTVLPYTVKLKGKLWFQQNQDSGLTMMTIQTEYKDSALNHLLLKNNITDFQLLSKQDCFKDQSYQKETQCFLNG